MTGALLLFLSSPVLPLPAPGARIDHFGWDAILRQNVTSGARVDYRSLKERALPDLDAYLHQLGEPWAPDMTPAATKAALISAYNAFTVRWIVSNYPVQSIWRTDDPFQTARHMLDGDRISLDGIESRLRQIHDPRTHSALVCAARRRPPLRREAYVEERIDDQLDDNSRRWLADPNLNEFIPQGKTARISAIFQWYGEDFDHGGGVEKFLDRFGPQSELAFLGGPDARLEYQTYNWGINDTSSIGSGYSRLNSYWDWVRNGYLVDQIKAWFLSLGREHGVNPFIFGGIYVGAIPFFSLCIAWLIRNLRRGRSPVAPALCASFFFVSAYLYLLLAGQNIPVWVYVFVAAMVAFGVYSTVRKVRASLHKGGRA